MTNQKQSNFTTVDTVESDRFIPVFSVSENEKISRDNFIEQIRQAVEPKFIYRTIDLLQAAPLEANVDEPTYVRCEETEYRLYKITSLAVGVDDIALNNGNTATYQVEYKDNGFVVGPASSTVGALAVYTDTSGELLGVGATPTTVGNALIQITSVAQKSFARVNADNTVTAATVAQVQTDLNLPANTVSELALKATTAFVQTEIDKLTVDTFNDFLTTPASVGQVFYLTQHTSGGVGGGEFEAYAEAHAATDGGTKINTATTGVRVRRINYDRLTLEMFGCLGGSVIDTAFANALSYSNTNKIPLFCEGTGYILSSAATITYDWVDLNGTHMPTFLSDYSALTAGTIFIGKLRFSGANISLKNLGVDHGITNFPLVGDKDDAIVLSNSSGAVASIVNCIGLCARSTDDKHAILVEGYQNTLVDNCVGVRSYYGLAAKLKKSLIRGFRAYQNTVAGVILRSNSPDGIIQDNIVSDIQTYGVSSAGSGSGGTDYGLYFVIDNQAERVVIDNVICRSAREGVSIRSNAAVNDVTVNNVITQDTTAGGFTTQNAAGTLFNLIISNHHHIDCAAWGVYPYRAVSLQASNIYCSSTVGSTYIDELFRVGVGVLCSDLDNIILSNNRSDTNLGAVRYDNAGEVNSIGSHNCFLSGNIPNNSLTNQPNLSGLTVTLSPEYYSSGVCVLKPTHTLGAITVTKINTTPRAGVKFPRGFRFVLFNDAVTDITIDRLSLDGYITRVAGTDDVIKPSRQITFVFDGAIWVPT